MAGMIVGKIMFGRLGREKKFGRYILTPLARASEFQLLIGHLSPTFRDPQLQGMMSPARRPGLPISIAWQRLEYPYFRWIMVE